MHLLKHSHVSNSRSRLPTSPSQDEDRDKQLKQSGAHFNSLPILFARINSPSRPQTNLRAEQIWKSRECTRKKQKGDRRWGHPSHTLYYCNQLSSNESSSTGCFLQQSQLQASWCSTGSISEQTTPKDGHTSHCRGRMASSHSADMHTFTGH